MFRALVVLLLLLLLGLQYRLWFGEPNLRDIWALDAQIELQNDINQELRQRNNELEAEVEDLKTGHAAIEERARSELGMIKKGETFFQLVEPKKKENSE